MKVENAWRTLFIPELCNKALIIISGNVFIAENFCFNQLFIGMRVVEMTEKVVVRTRDELEKAINSGYSRIIIRGELAEKVNTSLKIKTVSKYTIAILAASLAAVPFSAGLSLPAMALVSITTGLEISLIIAIVFIGLALVLLVVKDYKKVRFQAKHGDSEAEWLCCITRV